MVKEKRERGGGDRETLIYFNSLVLLLSTNMFDSQR